MGCSEGVCDESVGCLESLCSGFRMMRSDIDYDDDGFSDEESETDVPLTGGRPTPKWDQFRSVFITRSEVCVPNFPHLVLGRKLHNFPPILNLLKMMMTFFLGRFSKFPLKFSTSHPPFSATTPNVPQREGTSPSPPVYH